MTHMSTLLVRALAAALVLTPALGWKLNEALTENRTFEGRLSILYGRKLPNGQWKLLDEFQGSGIRFNASVLELATGKQVSTGWVLNGRTARGRPFSVRLAGPAQMESNLLTGQVDLRLPVDITVADKSVRRLVKLSTDASVAGPTGVLKGQRMKVQNGTSQVAVVGEPVIDIDLDRALFPTGNELAATEQRRPGVGTDDLVHISERIDPLGTTSLAVLSEGTVRAVEQ